MDKVRGPAPRKPKAKRMMSRYDGTCSVCSKKIWKGDWIYYDGKARHLQCSVRRA